MKNKQSLKSMIEGEPRRAYLKARQLDGLYESFCLEAQFPEPTDQEVYREIYAEQSGGLNVADHPNLLVKLEVHVA